MSPWTAAVISRVEPPFWWTGFEHGELQLLLHGDGIAAFVPIGVTHTAVLLDAAGNGIGGQTVDVTSANGNTLSAASLTTDSSGQAQVTVTASVAGMDTITATALGISATTDLNVSDDNFAVTAPVAGDQIILNTPTTVSATWVVGGVPQAGQTISFSATRGTLSSLTAVTDGTGTATVSIQSTNAGPSQIAGKLCHKNFFSTSFQNDQTPMAMGEVLNQQGVKSLYIIAPNYAAGQNMVAGVERTFKGEVKGKDLTKWGKDAQLDFSAELAKAKVDEFRVYDRRLTPIEVAQLYDGTALQSMLAVPSSDLPDQQRRIAVRRGFSCLWGVANNPELIELVPSAPHCHTSRLCPEPWRHHVS